VGLTREISATATVAHPPERVFEFLSDLRNHWRLEERFVELDDVTPTGGRVRVRGPLGLSRLARTRVLEAEPPPPGHLRGEAEVGRTTRGQVRWEIAPDGSGSRVTLAATPDRLSLVDLVLLGAGGRAWMERLFRNALLRLDGVLTAEGRD
jgi:uncharacterized protein YndB with AHSA1/START domain